VLRDLRVGHLGLHLLRWPMFLSPLVFAPAAMNTPLSTIIIYARDMQKTAAFYSEHFGFQTTGEVIEGLIELRASCGGAGLLIHQAAKSAKLGQVGVKLSFQVGDVRAFALAAEKKGLVFGPVHEANGYQFANAKDPDRNSVSISSRAFRSGGSTEV
jgi:predicted enzyme related to lactoylglutathione lyase